MGWHILSDYDKTEEQEKACGQSLAVVIGTNPHAGWL